MKDPTTRSILAGLAAVLAMIAYAALGRGAQPTEGFLAGAGQLLDWSLDRVRAGSWGIAAAALTFGGGAALAVAMLFTGARAYPLSWLGLLALAALVSWLTRRTAYFVPALYATPVRVDIAGGSRTRSPAG